MTLSAVKLREARLRVGLTQEEVPSVSQAAISALETGRSNPHPSTLRRLAKEYGVKVSDFFEDTHSDARPKLHAGGLLTSNDTYSKQSSPTIAIPSRPQ